jgi:PIN domain nuclease of toxin-antitoxin system
MQYLLDTATWVNNVLTPQVLPSRIRRLLDTSDVKGLCGVSLLETAIHHRRGRLEVSGTLLEFFDVALAKDIELIDLTPAIAAATNDLPEAFPGDPFDRTITATAHLLGLKLITPDPQIRDAQFCRVEYYPFRPSRARS